MRIEVNSAADFLMNLLRVRKANQLSENQLQHFKGSLEQILTRHFQRHWYPDVPNKGSGFRCLRINGKMDPIIEKAGHAAGLNAVALRKLLPLELTIWIDPDEVSYRIGENGTICVLYDIAQSRASPTSDLDSTGSSSGIACDEYIMERVGRLDLSVSSDSGTGSMVVDYLDHSTSTSSNQPSNGGTAATPAVPAATGGKQQQHQQHHKYNHSSNNNNNHHHYAKQRHSNSMSSSSSGQTSPPLSPPYGGGYPSHQQQQQQQQQPPSARYHNQHNNSSNYYSSSVHQQQQPYFHWGEFANNKVRTQC